MSIYSCIDRTPYTYLLVHHPTKKLYYGCKYKKGCHPNTFWVDYFTSSKIIAQLIKEYGKESFTFIIDQIFQTSYECILYEKYVLESVDAAGSDHWLNKTNGAENMWHNVKRESRSLSKLGEKNPSAKLTRL